MSAFTKSHAAILGLAFSLAACGEGAREDPGRN
jgi:predicted small lipoprotein YifL